MTYVRRLVATSGVKAAAFAVRRARLTLYVAGITVAALASLFTPVTA